MVGKVKNITLAAKTANLDQSGMSRHMIALEKELGAQLLLRRRDGVSFTEIGESVYETVCEMVRLSLKENQKIDKIRNDMTGSLQILTTQGIIRRFTTYLPEFYKLFPDTHLYFNVSRDFVESGNLENYDVSILPKFDDNHNLEYVPFEKQKLAVFASQKYLEVHGIPKKPEDLDHHKLISFFSQNLPSLGFVDFHLVLGRKDKKMRVPYLQLSAADSLIAACEQDMGIIVFVDDKGVPLPSNFVKILEKYHSENLDFHFIFPKKNKDSKKTREFIKFFQKKCQSND